MDEEWTEQTMGMPLQAGEKANRLCFATVKFYQLAPCILPQLLTFGTRNSMYHKMSFIIILHINTQRLQSASRTQSALPKLVSPHNTPVR